MPSSYLLKPLRALNDVLADLENRQANEHLSGLLDTVPLYPISKKDRTPIKDTILSKP